MIAHGSPPRAWGQSERPPAHHIDGLVHPHGRGDNTRASQQAGLSHGSPPRAWGQSTERLVSRLGARFTPTGVGTMAFVADPVYTVTVHPHGRGDNGGWLLLFLWRLGSPPRAWGQSIRYHGYVRLNRFTPTGVGTMSAIPVVLRHNAVHPHGRGDNYLRGVIAALRFGSPPRAWGK